MKTLNPYELDAMPRAYLECALWSSIDDNGDPFDANHSIEDFSQETLLETIEICKSFEEKARSLYAGIPLGDVGHNLWLTHNRHGTGFWDRDYENGKELTDLAHTFGERYLIGSDDGQLYIE